MEQKRRFDPTAMEFKVCINNVDGPFAVLAGRIVLPVGGRKKKNNFFYFFFFFFYATANNQRSNQPRASVISHAFRLTLNTSNVSHFLNKSAGMSMQ